MKNWADADALRALRLRDQGKSQSQIALIMGKTPSQIAGILSRIDKELAKSEQ